MIVDDAEMNREILMAILGDEYEYVQAENGRQAIHILQQDMNIDLMLLDINMPEMNGFQVLDRIEYISLGLMIYRNHDIFRGEERCH